MYVWRRPYGFSFQMRIPVWRADLLGTSPIRIPLGQIPASEARRRARVLAGAMTTWMGDIRVTREVLKHSLAALAAELDSARKDETFARPRLTYRPLATSDDAGSPDEVQLTGTYQWAMVRDPARNEKGKRQREQLEKIAGALSMDAAAWTAERETYRDIISMGVRMPAPVSVPDGAGAVPSLTRAENENDIQRDEREITADTLLSVAARIHLDTRKAAKADGSDKADRYQERLETSVAAFIDVVGDKPLRNYLPIHMQDFATVLGRVPINRSKYRFFDGLSLREIADKNDTRKKRIQRLSISTVEGSLSEMGSIWSKITSGVDGVRDLRSFKIIKPATASPATVREGLRPPALNTWMRSASEMSQAHKKWTPIVGLLTGMRLAEIVYLQSKDFTECEGFPIIDLQQNIFIQDKEIVRPLKNEWSDRVVALHPLLFEM